MQDTNMQQLITHFVNSIMNQNRLLRALGPQSMVHYDSHKPFNKSGTLGPGVGTAQLPARR